MEKITNSGHSDTYILVVLPFSNRPAATNHLDSGQFDWCFNLRTRRKWNLEDITKKKNSLPIKGDILQLLAANYQTHFYVSMLTFYFIRFLEKDTSVLPFLLCIKSCNEFPKNPEKMHYWIFCYKTLLVWYWVFLQVDLVFSEWVEFLIFL